MSKQVSSKEEAGALKGLRIQTVSLWLVAATFFVSVLIGVSIVQVMKDHQRLADMTKEYILAQEEAKNLLLGSNYLTDQVHLYAVTKDYSYAEAYFAEAEGTRRRDKALGQLEEHLHGKNQTVVEASRQALELSNALMEREIHSMKLVALATGEDSGRLLPRISEYPLTEEELSYTEEEMLETAVELVFGEEYRNMKTEIEQKLASVTENVIAICETELEESEASMKKALIRQSICIVIVVILVLFSYVMIAVLILRPIRIYANCIRNNNYLEITGAYEFKYLAATYNNVYEMTLEQQNMLRQKAERDALTGLLNRQSFEQLKKQLSGSVKPLAFLLVDVDVFKSINDNYGHDMGDQALIKVANLLDENFRRGDYVMRIGGDEFAVIMEKIEPDNRQIIIEKIDLINDRLLHPQGDFPKYSISVGVAFSDSGFHDELFRRTDEALYHTKENGRCGYTFYEDLV